MIMPNRKNLPSLGKLCLFGLPVCSQGRVIFADRAIIAEMKGIQSAIIAALLAAKSLIHVLKSY
jgi:hypothetical protein